MHEEQDLKLTDLDYLTGNHHLQMMKAALPYMEVPEQKMLSVFVKINELQRTISLFRDEEVATMGICSLDNKRSPLDMLNAMKPYGNSAEQDMIDLFSSFLQGGRMSGLSGLFQGAGFGGENTSFTAAEGPTDNDFSGGSEIPGSGGTGPSMKRPPFEQLKAFLSPEQQSRFETMQMMMQAMQQFT